MIDTTIALAFTSGMLAVGAASPAGYATDIASIFGAIFGGLIIQLWTSETRKPTRRVMCADIMASAFAGFASKVAGVPFCLAIINKFMPGGTEIKLDGADNLGAVIVISGVAGMLGAGVIRKVFDKVNPGWGTSNGKP